MPDVFVQQDRLLQLTTPLGKDVLIPRAFSGSEAISSLFHFHVDVLAENRQPVEFDKLLGQKVTLGLKTVKGDRYFNGVVNAVSQGGRDERFTGFRLELVPTFWLLTRIAQTKIFQYMTVPAILQKVLTGLDVAYELKGKYEPRDYCTQYRESDYQFASRLMEEEGIYYYFKHSSDGHKMVVADSPDSHSDTPENATMIYEEITGGTRPEDRIYEWEKLQELRSGKVTLWDHCFELPDKHLEAEKTIQEQVAVGKITHKLRVGNNDKLELYDYPGAYAQRFDGIDRGGGEKPGDVSKIFTDNKRTVDIRMQQEGVNSVLIRGASNCRQMGPGYKFNLTRHFNGDGQYVVTSMQYTASQPTESDSDAWTYGNEFTCIPYALPFRPQRSTPRPFVAGSQTAVVVGPSGDEIFTDKYGRVKVQFHWDREGKYNAESSCWVRVGTALAGKQWGMIHIPRIGQEVIVDFLEGDPDQPIIIGSVYNATQMPPYKLPANKTQSGIKTRSSLVGGEENFNELCFEDKKGEELVYLRAEKDFTEAVENDHCFWAGHDQMITVDNNRTEIVTQEEKVTIEKGNRSIYVDMGNDKHQIKMGNREVKIDMGNDSLKISMGNQTTKLDLGKSETEALQSIELKVGQSSVKLDQTGVTIKGMLIKIEGQVMVQVKGLMVQQTADAIMTIKGGLTMIN